MFLEKEEQVFLDVNSWPGIVENCPLSASAMFMFHWVIAVNKEVQYNARLQKSRNWVSSKRWPDEQGKHARTTK